MEHSGRKLFTFGASLFSASFVSVKLSLWGYGIWMIYVPNHPIFYVLLILGLLVLPWLAIIVRIADAAVQQEIEVYYGVCEDETERRLWEGVDEAMVQSFGWLTSATRHPVSSGIITGGIAGVTVSIVKVIFPLAQWLTIAVCLGITYLFVFFIASAYWNRASKKMISGLKKSLEANNWGELS